MAITKTIIRKHFIDSDTQSAEVVPTRDGNVVALCRRCPGREECNDDSAAVVETESGAVILIIADGVGGGPLGHKASAIAVESITESITNFDGDDLRSAILNGIESANREILEMGVGAATTVSIVEIQNRIARGYQVGDSQTLIVGQRGAIRWKSTPHSPVGYAVESGMLDESDAMHHEERHVVSNLVGSREMHIEIGPAVSLSQRDTVIVGSDGLYDNLHLEEVIAKGCAGKPANRVTALADLATLRMGQSDPSQPGKPDDLSILMFTLS
jgi:serine/threonine protein phosphatase PrpC